MKLILRRLLSPFIFLVTLFIVFEEWLWIRLTWLTLWIAQWWVIAQLESLIRKLPAWAALVTLLTPSLIIIPFKVIALYLVVHQHVYLGILSILLAKVFGTALVARIFVLTKEKVLTIQWFFYLYTKINALINWAWQWLKSQPLYNRVRNLISEYKIKALEFIRSLSNHDQ